MINRKKTINKIALATMLITLSLLTVAVMTNRSTTGGSNDTIESFYGKAIFGGQFAWMDNVKRPGLNSTMNLTQPLKFDFELSNAVSPSMAPNQDMQLIASIIEPSYYGNSFTGPFDNEPGNGGLVNIEQVFVGGYYYSDDDDNFNPSGSPFQPEDPIIIPGDDDPDDPGDETVIVPLPGSVTLAMIGIAGFCGSRFKRRKQ